MTAIKDYLEDLFIQGLEDDGCTTQEAQEALQNERDWNSDGNEQIY